MKKFITLFTILAITSICYANQTVENYLLKSFSFHSPIQTDTVNALGEKFDSKVLLQTEISTCFNKGSISTVTTNENGELTLNQPSENHIMYISGFNVWCDRFTNATLKITTQNMVEVYIDGKKIKDKLTQQDSISAASEISCPIKIEPNVLYRVSIKTLSSASDNGAATIKCEIEQKDNEELFPINITTKNSRFYELKDNHLGTRVTSTSLSPNGKYLLSSYFTRFELGKDRIYYQTLTEVKSGKIILPKITNRVSWMPKSNKLYYTETAKNGVNIATIDPSTLAEEVLYTNIKGSDFIWSPAEDYLIYTIKEEARKKEGDLILQADPMDRVNGRGRNLLAKYNIENGVSERITFGNRSSYMQDITADGKKLLMVTMKKAYTEIYGYTYSFYEVDMNTFATETILTDALYISNASYSPDASEILFTGGPEAFDKIGLNAGDHEYANSSDNQAFIMNKATKEVRAITKDFDPSIEFSTWNKTNKCIYFIAEEETRKTLYEYNPSKDSWKKLNTECDLVNNISISDNGTIISYTGASLSHATRSYTYDVKKGVSTLVDDPTKDFYADIQLGKDEEFKFNTEDGTTIDGFIVYPPNFDANKKYPLIVYYYGGTSPSQRRGDIYYGGHIFASRGYIVYILNPSGTTGYGQEFSARHVNAWGIRTADEIIEGTKLVCDKYSFIDKTKIGCIGASYGGFMTQYLQTKTDIFAAAVSHAGISDVTSYWGEGFWGVGYSKLAAAGSYPWNNPKLYTEQGSLFNADKINTPLLLLHGSEDTNVPIGESIQIYNALKVLGKEVEFIVVNGENHTIIKDLNRQQKWHNSIMAWFAKWLQESPEWWNELYPKVYTE